MKHRSLLLVCATLAMACGSPDDGKEPSELTTPGDPPNMPGDPPSTPDALACNLAPTGFAGDEYCILPPPDGQGFQIHYGPSDFTDTEEVATYLVAPGTDTIIFAPVQAGNTEDVYFYKRQYRMRPGSHHLIVSESGGSNSVLGLGRRLGGSQNTRKDNPEGPMPPENEGIGMPLAANASLNMNLHHFNGTTEPIVREAWVNFWYVDPSTVTQEAKEMFLWAQGAPIAPGESAVVKGTHAITEAGRVLTMYGHRHSNNVRFSAYRTRAGVRELVLDDYDWTDPTVLEFNTTSENAASNSGTKQAGGHSGVLDLVPGDALDWECEVENHRTEVITFGENEAATSEMCILVGDAIGPALLGAAFF